MTNIKSILDEIANESGSNAKMDILRKHKDNDLLKRVMYMAKSPRLKYYIKQIPEYVPHVGTSITLLESCLDRIMEGFATRLTTGNDAKAALSVMLENLHPDDAYVIVRIIEKDLKIGMGTSNINKIFPKLIEKTPYMGAKSFSEKLAKEIFNPKTRELRKKLEWDIARLKWMEDMQMLSLKMEKCIWNLDLEKLHKLQDLD